MSTTIEEKDQNSNLLNAGFAGGSAEVVQRYGSAVKEHVVAYSGKDNEARTQLTKGLKSISNSKVNKDTKNQNLKQQAGFSAEVKETANANAENIINGNDTRKSRTDDMGSVNDPLYDHVQVDAFGNIITNSGSQMKFVGGTPKDALNKLMSKKFQKYLDNDVLIDVPSDYYDKILMEADKEIERLKKQVENQLAKGNKDTAEHLKKKIENYQKIKKNLRKSTVSTKDAMFARLHPKLSTAKDIVKISHRAGVETAKMAGIVGGSVSIVQNLVAVVKGDEDVDDAVKNVAKDTGTSVAVGYGTGFVGSALKGVMQNSGSQTIRGLSKTNIPGVVVTVAVSATKTMNRYFQGDITGTQCFEELGEQGVGMISSSVFAIIGQTVIPIPVVGGLIGGMVGYALASASYGALLTALKDEKLAYEERLHIEQVCNEHIQMIRTFRLEIEKVISEYLVLNMQIFHESLNYIKESLAIGNPDGVIRGSNEISKTLGKKPQFQSIIEFNGLMNSNEIFRL